MKTETIYHLDGAALYTTAVPDSDPRRVRTIAEQAVADGADLRGANLAYAKLKGADLRGANLAYAKLKGANLTGADLTGANLTHANLTLADLGGADLTRTNFTGANLGGANLALAILTDVIGIPEIRRDVTAPQRHKNKNQDLIDAVQAFLSAYEQHVTSCTARLRMPSFETALIKLRQTLILAQQPCQAKKPPLADE